MKTDWRDVAFWILLIISMVLLVWNVFGKSPSEFIALITIIFMVILKLWSVSDRGIKLESRLALLEENTKKSFNNMKNDINLIKEKLKIKK